MKNKGLAMYKQGQKIRVLCKHDKRDMWASDGNGHNPDDEIWYEAHIKQGEILDCTVWIAGDGYPVFDFEHNGIALHGQSEVMEYALEVQDDEFSFYFEIMENES